MELRQRSNSRSMNPSLDLSDSVALVTGGSRRIGAAIALALGCAGAAVGVHFHQNREGASKVVRRVEEHGGKAIAVQANIAVKSEVDRMVNETASALGPVDILVNNARHLGAHKHFLDLTWEDYQAQLDVGLKGAFYCCQAVLPSMVERGGGRIINMLSTAINEYIWQWHVYAAVKMALLSFSRNLAAEMGEYGITVNMVSPGWTKTDRETPHTEEYQREYLKGSPMGRLTQPEDVVQAVLFFARRGSGFITGANLPVCGGRMMF